MTDERTNHELIDLTGRRALVTGAAKGIGAAIAARLAAAGAHVTVADLDGGAGQSTADALTALGHSAGSVRCDITDATQLADAIASQPVTAPSTSS